MNKQSISKINFFLMGLINRFDENKDIFKNIKVIYKVGLKSFNGIGEFYEDKINFNFNGKTEIYTFNNLTEFISNTCANYDSCEITYSERGSSIIITADNKNVKMNTKEIKEEIKEIHNESTSTLLNRNYYIKPGKATKLLQAIDIMGKDEKVKNDKIRKYNQIDHYVELLDKIFDSLSDKETLTILDCGCGKSYLSFVLNYYLTEVKKRKCHFIGLDISETVINTSKKIANELDYRNMEFHSKDIKDYKPSRDVNIVISLHACNTATDMAIALGIKLNSDCIIAVPCCHKELLSQYSYEPFKSITKYGILKARLADTLTDGMRGLMLEAKGYNVSIVEYISPLETPKNLMIRALKIGKDKPELLNEYMSLCKNLNASPSLLKFLDEKWKS